MSHSGREKQQHHFVIAFGIGRDPRDISQRQPRVGLGIARPSAIDHPAHTRRPPIGSTSLPEAS